MPSDIFAQPSVGQVPSPQVVVNPNAAARGAADAFQNASAQIARKGEVEAGMQQQTNLANQASMQRGTEQLGNALTTATGDWAERKYRERMQADQAEIDSAFGELDKDPRDPTSSIKPDVAEAYTKLQQARQLQAGIGVIARLEMANRPGRLETAMGQQLQQRYGQGGAPTTQPSPTTQPAGATLTQGKTTPQGAEAISRYRDLAKAALDGGPVDDNFFKLLDGLKTADLSQGATGVAVSVADGNPAAAEILHNAVKQFGGPTPPTDMKGVTAPAAVNAAAMQSFELVRDHLNETLQSGTLDPKTQAAASQTVAEINRMLVNFHKSQGNITARDVVLATLESEYGITGLAEKGDWQSVMKAVGEEVKHRRDYFQSIDTRAVANLGDDYKDEATRLRQEAKRAYARRDFKTGRALQAELTNLRKVYTAKYEQLVPRTTKRPTATTLPAKAAMGPEKAPPKAATTQAFNDGPDMEPDND